MNAQKFIGLLLQHPSDVPNIDGMERCINMWFTNNTFIPGEQTIPEDMLDNLGIQSYILSQQNKIK